MGAGTGTVFDGVASKLQIGVLKGGLNGGQLVQHNAVSGGQLTHVDSIGGGGF